MVLLDVVYNHFGPEGNYIGQYFPDIVTRQYQTPWGQALNFDAKHSERTREFIVQNALYWIREVSHGWAAARCRACQSSTAARCIFWMRSRRPSGWRRVGGPCT